MDIYYLCFVTVYYLLLCMIDNKSLPCEQANSPCTVRIFEDVLKFPSAAILVNRPKLAEEKVARTKVTFLTGDRISH